MNLTEIIKDEIIKFIKEDTKGELGDWFDEKWVDISRTNKDGSHPPCGASAGEGKREKEHFKKYPKCVKKSKADNMSKKEKESAVKRKRKDVKQDSDKSTPTNTKTDSKKKK